MMVMSEAKKTNKGIQYEQFITTQAVPMINSIIDVDESLQWKRTQAWKQVQEAEDEAEQILGMTRYVHVRVRVDGWIGRLIGMCVWVATCSQHVSRQNTEPYTQNTRGV